LPRPKMFPKVPVRWQIGKIAGFSDRRRRGYWRIP
jgi:hypothetical protein